jgi:hypothetical protein
LPFATLEKTQKRFAAFAKLEDRHAKHCKAQLAQLAKWAVQIATPWTLLL